MHAQVSIFREDGSGYTKTFTDIGCNDEVWDAVEELCDQHNLDVVNDVDRIQVNLQREVKDLPLFRNSTEVVT